MVPKQDSRFARKVKLISDFYSKKHELPIGPGITFEMSL